MQATTHNAAETQAIAKEFATTLHGGELVLLIGDLGAGKTTFVQALSAALGVTTRVTSPTFSIMNEYPVPEAVSDETLDMRDNADQNPQVSPLMSHRSIRRVVHIDLYRFTNENELRALALEDERRPDSVVLIEWPNAIAHDPSTSLRTSFAADAVITIAHAGGDTRSVTLAV